MKIRKKLGRIHSPGWIFLPLHVAYSELMLHIWITEELQAGRVMVVLAFALGFGTILALITSLIPSARGAKWATIGLSAVVSVIWLMEYFISDAYSIFMTPTTIISGASGVAEDYRALVLSMLARNLWRIGLMLLPVLLYALFCRSGKANWKLRGILAAAAAVLYLLGIGAVRGLTGDASVFSTVYHFDRAVRNLGLGMALTLETGHGFAAEMGPAFVAAPTAPERAPEEMFQVTEPTVVYGDNVLEGVDFNALAESAGNKSISAIYSYVASRSPSKRNAYTGLFAGKNLILITAEAFTAEVIDPERTPTLYRLANEGIKFLDYYQPAWGASTTSGEFSNVIGIVPTNGGACMKEAIQQDLFLTMGHQLQKLDYYSVAYHNHLATFYDRDKTHTHLGYDRYLAQYGGLEGIAPVWPESDLEMMDVTVPQYIDQQPFSVYYMTVSGHCPYTQKENARSRANYEAVADMDCSEELKGYFAAQMELEYAMESLVRQLEEAGIADDTVIVLATDHYPYGLERSSTWKNKRDNLKELYGVEEYDNFIRDHNALIIWSGCIEDMDIVVDAPVYSLDILPTLSNLFGVPYDSRLLVGRDVFSEETPLVLWPDYSWKTDKGTYNAKVGTFTPVEGMEAEETYVEYMAYQVSGKIAYSRAVLDTDFFNYLAKAMARGE